jgi:hypothetical protein
LGEAFKKILRTCWSALIYLALHPVECFHDRGSIGFSCLREEAAELAKNRRNVAGEEEIGRDIYPRLAHSAPGISRLGDCRDARERIDHDLRSVFEIQNRLDQVKIALAKGEDLALAKLAS